MSRSLYSPALDQALVAFRTPGIFGRLREIELPEDVLLLIRIAAGEAEAREWACRASGEVEATVCEAAALFIQQVMFHPDSDSYRVLGVSPLAGPIQLKEHHRWLVRWLHPDRNPDEWDAVYADRVNRAWQDLRTDTRRHDYDARRDGGASAVRRQTTDVAISRTSLSAGLIHANEFVLSKRVARLLPALIVGGLVMSAAGALGLLYYLSREEAREMRPVEVARIVAAPAPIAADPVAIPPTPTPEPEPAPEPETELAPAPEPVTSPAMIPVVQETAAPTLAVVREPVVDNVAAPVEVPTPAPIAARVRQPEPPVAIATPAPPPAAPPTLIDEATAQQIMLRFREAYASGNIQQVRALLVHYGQGGSDEGRAILESYGQLFNSSASRRIELRNPSWLTDGDTAILLASYDAWVVPRGKSKGQRFRGDIRFDLRLEDGQLRIAKLRQNSEQG